MIEAWDFIRQLFNPESIILYGGILLLLAVVFAETGLFFGFFLPGDSLLFTAGLLCGTGVFDIHIMTLLLSVTAAGILGNIAGYYFGYKAGPPLFRRDDSLLFKKRYVRMARDFYDRQGGLALIAGRFLPIIRTFAPILAGVIKMNFGMFMFYNIIGCVLWVFSLISAGYFLSSIFPGIGDYLGYIIIGLIVITAIPVIGSYRRQKEAARKRTDTLEKELPAEKTATLRDKLMPAAQRGNGADERDDFQEAVEGETPGFKIRNAQ